MEEKISKIEDTVQVLFEQSEEKRYKYLEVNILGNKEYHKQMNGLYIKHWNYNNRATYLKIYPVVEDYERTYIVWDPILQKGIYSWKFVHNGEIIAIFEDQILINPISSNKRTIFRNNFEKETIDLKPLDFAPVSQNGNYYEQPIYKYVIYRFEMNDQNYVTGLAKYSPCDAKFETFLWTNNGIKPDLANDFSWTVKNLLDKISNPKNRYSSIFHQHLPTSMFSGSPLNFHVHFFPLLDSNIAAPPTHELRESMNKLAKVYRVYRPPKVETNISRFWAIPKQKIDDDDDVQNFDDMDALEYFSSTNDRTSESTINLLCDNDSEINLESQKKQYEDLQNAKMILHHKYDTLQKFQAKRDLEYEEIKKMVNDYQVTYMRELQESQLKIEKLLAEKESLQKQLSEAKESFQNQLSQEKEFMQKHLSQKLFQKKLSQEQECLQKELYQEKKFRIQQYKNNTDMKKTIDALTAKNAKLLAEKESFQKQLSQQKEFLEKQLSQEKESFQKKLSQEKEFLQKELSQENKSFQKQLSQEKKYLQKQLFQQKKFRKQQYKNNTEMKTKIDALTAENAESFNENIELSKRIDFFSDNKTLLENEVKTLKKNFETNYKEKKEQEKKVENSCVDNVKDLLNNVDQSRLEQSAKSEITTPQIDILTIMQGNELEENFNASQNHQNVVNNANQKPVKEFYNFDSLITSLNSIIDTQKQN
jgi:hypothetical protein